MIRFIFLLAALAVSLFADAQQNADAEKDHVRVTLNDGRVVEGYIRTYWVSGKLFKRMNTSFKMSSTPDGKDVVSYDADNVRSIDFKNICRRQV